MKVLTQYNPPPIPTRRFDWVACLDSYDEGDPIGWGRTEDDAIEDLLTQVKENDENLSKIEPSES